MPAVTVRGPNILKPPLLESDDVKVIIVRDSFDKPMIAVLHLADDTWGVSCSKDEDWPIVVERYGIK